jgi:hypothetical protein
MSVRPSIRIELGSQWTDFFKIKFDIWAFFLKICWESLMVIKIWTRLTGIPIYIQQDATLYSLFYLEIALHVLGGGTTRNM